MFNVFGNATDVSSSNWRPPPKTRGTWDILSTCLITLGLCVWTVLHLNIPHHREGPWAQFMRKASWLLIGLFAPEMLAFTAWCQRHAACSLTSTMQRKFGQPKTQSGIEKIIAFLKSCRDRVRYTRDRGAGRASLPKYVESQGLYNQTAAGRHRWTLAHSFYVLMGGFVFDTDSLDVKILPDPHRRLTLSLKGLNFLLEHEPDLIPNISEKVIIDKSKASPLVKTIVCLQALWFCVQCIIRLVQGLAVSLLELNVFGHAICAFLIYLFWWDKPLDIAEPTILTGSMVNEMCAFMCMQSHPSGNGQVFEMPTEIPHGVVYGSKNNRTIVHESYRHTKDDEYNASPWLSELVSSAQSSTSTLVHMLISLLPNSIKPPRSRSLQCRLAWYASSSSIGQESHGSEDAVHPVTLEYAGKSAVSANQARRSPAPTSSKGAQMPDSSNLLASTISLHGFYLTLGRWSSLSNGRQKFNLGPAGRIASTRLSDIDVTRWQLCERALAKYRRSSDGSSNGFELQEDNPAANSVNGTHIYFAISIASILYGGLHLVAWNAPFRSDLEHILWRSSGVITAAFGVTYCLVVGSLDLVVKLGAMAMKKYKAGLRSWIIDALIGLEFIALFMLLALYLVAVVVARVYLLTECFLQIAYLPDSAYTLPSWSQYFPHIG